MHHSLSLSHTYGRSQTVLPDAAWMNGRVGQPESDISPAKEVVLLIVAIADGSRAMTEDTKIILG